MARIRTVKPEFFRHEALYEAEKACGLPLRLAFAGLWTACDREGRFVWKPRALKLDALPYDDVDFATVLDALAAHGFIVKYETGGASYGHIPSWAKHQHVNQRECASLIPAPDGPASESPAPDGTDARTCTHLPAPVVSRGEGEGKGREEEKESEGKGEAAPAQIPRDQARVASEQRPHATRWPKNAVVAEQWLRLGEAARARHGLAPLDLRLEAEKFANYWAARERDAVRADWQKTWLNWILKADTHGRGASASTGKSSHPFGVFGALLEAERGRAPGDAHGGVRSDNRAGAVEGDAGAGGHLETSGAAQRDLRAAARSP